MRHKRAEFHGDRGCKLCYGTGYCRVCIGGGVNGSEDPCRTCGGDGMCGCARTRLKLEADRIRSYVAQRKKKVA